MYTDAISELVEEAHAEVMDMNDRQSQEYFRT